MGKLIIFLTENDLVVTAMVAHQTSLVTGLSVDTLDDLLQSNDTSGHITANNLDNLYPALVQCFGIILLGFLAGKFSFISDVEAKGLGTFVGVFSLPALIFVSLCQLDFHSVNWVFLASIALAKSIIFFLVLLVGLFIHRPLDLSRPALYAIFCTQSNDFALGFPVLNAIYGESHPEYPQYLYLLAPVSLAVLNPIGFVMMEIGKMGESSSQMSRSKIASKVMLGIVKNPIMMMTLLGILGNLVFHSQMPSIIHNFMQTLGSAFSSSALFLLGLRMVGQNGGSAGSDMTRTSVILPGVLITMKSLVLPIISREIVYQLDAGGSLNATTDLSNYAFLYGTIPTAPSVFVYAANFEVLQDVTASAITASTFIAAPLMFVTAKLLTLMNMDPSKYIDQLDIFLLDISVVGLIAAGWVVFVLIMTGKAAKMPHRITLLLTVCQASACLGAAFWSLLDCRHGWRLYLQFVLFAVGVFGSRVCTGVLAVTILLLQTRGVCLVSKWRHGLAAVAVVLPAIIVLCLALTVSQETPEHGDKTDPNFQYGKTQTVAALVTLLLTLTVTLLSLVLGHRYQAHQQPPASTAGTSLETDEDTETDALLSDGSDTVQETSVEIEDLMLGREEGGACARGRYRCDSEHRKFCSGLISRYEVPPAEDVLSPDSILNTGEDQDDQQIIHHQILLLLLSLSMFGEYLIDERILENLYISI